MNKLSLDALKERAEVVASVDLLNSISGGTENACHDQDDQDDEHPLDYMNDWHWTERNGRELIWLSCP